MCGIAGFIEKSIPPAEARERLGAMLDRISHRGPDGSGTHFSGPLAMGMRRLSIIDLAGGWQPIWNEDRSLAVVFNGEIYNYVELRERLSRSGHNFSTHTDTEVLVHLYEERGLEMFAELRGMFAFAIHDTRENRLVLARDHFGQKPLYYYSRGGTFAFASELKCLLALPQVSRELDPEAFLDYIAWFSLPAPQTHFQHIRKLPAGSCMTVPLAPPNEATVTKFWSYDLQNSADLRDAEEAAEQLDHALHESVKLHLRADVPVGVLLSSGLDSRCVAAYAQEIQGGKVSTFSVGFRGGDSELTGAAQTAREINSRHFAIELDEYEFAESVEKIAWHLDEPIGDPAAFAVLKVCELARGHVKVLLSGEGADELFAGYAGRYQGMLHTLARSEKMRRFAPLLPHANGSRSSRWQRLCDRAHLKRGEEAVSLRIEGFPGDVRQPRGLTSAQLGQLRARRIEIAQHIFRAQRDVLSELLVLDLEWQLAESLLQKADKMSMGASIELRTPILDTAVAALAARMDSSLKMHATGPGKLVLRKCLARRIPEVANRPKKGFPVPLANWFRSALRGHIEDVIFAANPAWSKYLDSNLVRLAWRDFLDGKWNSEHVFYALWLYEVWSKKVLKS
jgi:asparagine synthase (glutamine-hydrolysing)